MEAVFFFLLLIAAGLFLLFFAALGVGVLTVIGRSLKKTK